MSNEYNHDCDCNVITSVVFAVIAELRVGSTVTEAELHAAAWHHAHDFTPAGCVGDTNYAVCLNAMQVIKDDWQDYITVEEL